MEKEPEIPRLSEMEAIFKKEADGTITRWESNILIEWTDKYDKDWKIADEKIKKYKEQNKEIINSSH